MTLIMRLLKRENGYWYVEIERDKYRSLKTKDEAVAKKLFRAMKKALLKGRLVELDSGKRINLNEFKTKFFEKHTDIDDDTISAYDLAFRLLIDSIGGSTVLSRIDDKEIGKFKKDCLARGCRKTSVNTYVRHIRGILNKAHEWGDIKKKVKIKFFKIPKRHPRILSKSEIDRILEYTKKHEPEMYRIIVFALWTGARREEIQTLVWQNVYGTTARLIGKGGKERTIPLVANVIEVMGEKKDVGHIFAQWHLDTYTHKFKKIVRRFGIEDIHLHTLRHTAATQMLASGIEIEYVQEMLGHEDLSTTQIYAQILQNKLANKMKKMTYDE